MRMMGLEILAMAGLNKHPSLSVINTDFNIITKEIVLTYIIMKSQWTQIKLKIETMRQADLIHITF